MLPRSGLDPPWGPAGRFANGINGLGAPDPRSTAPASTDGGFGLVPQKQFRVKPYGLTGIVFHVKQCAKGSLCFDLRHRKFPSAA